ncbi:MULTISPECIES: hypothetical protein [unclassified Streptomyces]|uniref:hypothetical protein n=1 Tax=unclassified Streptomyces TaxID=2593676 RepID=UPI002E2E73F0|nr:hypothetical protein [Streptomyces sp. NBC_01429]
MAEVRLGAGVNPDDPEAVVLVVAVDEDGPPAERAVARLGLRGYESDGCLCFVRTDGWAERRLDGEELTVDIVAYPAVLDSLEIDRVAFPERSAADPDAIRLLRVRAQVAPEAYEQALALTAVLTLPAATPLEQGLAALRSGEDWPLILTPPPE